LAHDIGGSFSTAMDYMQQVYNRTSVWNALQADYVRRYAWDEFGYHFYISQGSLVQTTQLANYFNAVRSTQATNNDPSDITVTEFGWQTVGSNTQELQRANMATSYNYMESQPYISQTFWYQWIDEPTVKWGIVNNSGQPKLAYHEFVARNAAQPGNDIVSTTHHAANDTSLGYSYSSSDVLQGRIPVELAPNYGWHPDNPAHDNPNNRNGLKAFTDGVGAYGVGTTGLLADYPPAGTPAKSIDYTLGGAHDVNEIRIFTGNAGNDGRIFSTTAVWSSRNGVNYDFLGYFQSDPSGTPNNASTPGGAKGATLVRIFREDGSPLAEDATHLRFNFFAASELGGVMRDPFNGVNSFTGTNDGLAAAYMSPMVREIDVLGVLTGVPIPWGDYNEDYAVDAADYVAWRKRDGLPVEYQTWQSHFGETANSGSGSQSSMSAVPEPGTLWNITVALLMLVQVRRKALR
jgi:hypothetical protein